MLQAFPWLRKREDSIANAAMMPECDQCAVDLSDDGSMMRMGIDDDGIINDDDEDDNDDDADLDEDEDEDAPLYREALISLRGGGESE